VNPIWEKANLITLSFMNKVTQKKGEAGLSWLQKQIGYVS
jgi:hypothetical protein